VFSAVGFDLGDTLVDYVGVALSWQDEYARALAEVCSALGLTPAASAISLAESVLVRHNTRLTPREREVTDAELFGELFGALGLTRPADTETFDNAVDAFFAVFRRGAVGAPGGVDAVAGLQKSGVRLGVLTDVAYAMPRRLVEDDLAMAGLERLTATTLTSVDVGWRKPRPEGFEALAETLGVRPGEMLYVGNEQKDVVGARAAGASVALLWRSAEPVPDWGQDHTIRGLGQIDGLIV
jgi:putative hydrolase of the HAD superfamily